MNPDETDEFEIALDLAWKNIETRLSNKFEPERLELTGEQRGLEKALRIYRKIRDSR